MEVLTACLLPDMRNIIQSVWPLLIFTCRDLLPSTHLAMQHTWALCCTGCVWIGARQVLSGFGGSHIMKYWLSRLLVCTSRSLWDTTLCVCRRKGICCKCSDLMIGCHVERSACWSSQDKGMEIRDLGAQCLRVSATYLLSDPLCFFPPLCIVMQWRQGSYFKIYLAQSLNKE